MFLKELNVLESWTCYFTLISESISEIEITRTTDSIDVLSSLVSKLTCCIEGVMRLRNHVSGRHHDSLLVLQNEGVSIMYSLLTILDHVICNVDEEVCSLKSKVSTDTDSSIVQLPCVEYSGLPGRPKLCVNIEQISSLRALGLSWVVISQMLGISQSTLYHQCSDLGFEDCAMFHYDY